MSGVKIVSRGRMLSGGGLCQGGVIWGRWCQEERWLSSHYNTFQPFYHMKTTWFLAVSWRGGGGGGAG